MISQEIDLTHKSCLSGRAAAVQDVALSVAVLAGEFTLMNNKGSKVTFVDSKEMPAAHFFQTLKSTKTPKKYPRDSIPKMCLMGATMYVEGVTDFLQMWTSAHFSPRVLSLFYQIINE